MDNMETNTLTIEKTYASILRILGNIGLVLLVAGFLIYSLGFIPSEIPPKEVADMWHLRATEYTEQTGFPAGWNEWTDNIYNGERISLFTLLYMGSIIIIALTAAAVMYLKNKNFLHSIITLCLVTVLICAASGILTGAH